MMIVTQFNSFLHTIETNIFIQAWVYWFCVVIGLIACYGAIRRVIYFLLRLIDCSCSSNTLRVQQTAEQFSNCRTKGFCDSRHAQDERIRYNVWSRLSMNGKTNVMPPRLVASPSATGASITILPGFGEMRRVDRGDAFVLFPRCFLPGYVRSFIGNRYTLRMTPEREERLQEFYNRLQ